MEEVHPSAAVRTRELVRSDRRSKKYPHVKGVAGNISANDKGVKFISDFRKSCRGCRVSRYSFHWLVAHSSSSDARRYNKAGRSVSDGMRKLKEFTHQVEKAAGGTKLMVTEFMARTSKTSQQRDLLKKAVAFFKSSSKITDWSVLVRCCADEQLCVP